MTTVSARPENLAAFHSRLEAVDRDLRSAAGSLLSTLQTYRARCAQYGADHTELAYALGNHASAMEELNGWVGRVGEAFRHADRAPGPVPVGVVLTTEESVKVAEPEFEELEPEGGMDAKAVAALIADIAGIFDPTPISDGVAAGIDISDGDFAGAGLSLLSMIPYLGDAVAKPVKFVKRILENFPALKRLAESGALLDLLKHIDWRNPVRLNRALGTLASLQRKAELAYKNQDWLNKARRLGLPTEGGVPFVPPKGWDVNFPKMESVGGRAGYVDAFGNVWIKRTRGGDWDIQARKGFEPLTKDGRSLSVSNDGKLQDARAPSPLPDLRIDDAQFGKKIGKHAQDYGLDPSDPQAREWLRNHIENVARNSDEVRQGPWNPHRGGTDDSLFYRQGNDVVVTKADGTFVTILKDGHTNGWYNGAGRVR